MAAQAGACTCSPGASVTGAPSASASALVIPAPTSTDTVVSAADELKPVYPVDAGPPDPLAQRFCEAVMHLPDVRRSECCKGGGSVAAAFTAQCVRTLTFALGQHALELAPADVDRCVEAQKRATAGCDWIVPNGRPVAAECKGIIKGKLPEKTKCRSSLECAGTMRCQGLSTIDFGACGPPVPDRSRCGVAADMLAAFTRQDQLDEDHPECAGFCGRHQCLPAAALGGACATDHACAPGGHCSGGTCVAKTPAVGEPCADLCAEGSRCLKGTCAVPKAEGAACDVDEECRGTCVRPDAGVAGVCAMACVGSVRPVIAPPPPAKPLKKR